MAGIIDLLRLFKLTAVRANGSGVAGAQVRILNAANADVTASFFGTGLPVDPVTDAQGVLTKLFLVDTQQLPAGQVYTIQVTAPGFLTWSFATATTFIGAADLTANLARPNSLDGYTVTLPPSAPVSSMIPIVTVVASPNAFDWEYIRCEVANANGATSVLEAPVDKATHQAVIDFHNRVKLGIRPLLVADGQTARPDTDFSTVVDVSFSSLSDEGETPILPEENFDPYFSQSVAHTLPPDGETDLSSYVATTSRRWIVPSEPVIAFRGYYRDVMIWLPPASGALTLVTTYLNSAGGTVSSTVIGLTASPFVQRIRLDTDPGAGIESCVLTIKLDTVVITKPLTVRYRD